MRKRYGEPGQGWAGPRRFNTFSGRSGSRSRMSRLSRLPASGATANFRERTKSAPPPLRRMRSKSEDSSHRRRSSASPWRERRTHTSFSNYPGPSSDQTYPASALASSKWSRRQRASERDRQSSYYTRKAQSFMDKRFLPT